jgi:hypothetical protein
MRSLGIGSNVFRLGATFDPFSHFIRYTMAVAARVLLLKASQGDALVLLKQLA